MRATISAAFVLLSALAMVSCANVSYAAPSSQEIVIGNQIVQAEMVGAASQPALDRSQAVALATRYVPTAAAASAVEASHVSLTLVNSDGSDVQGIKARPVWLVVFKGANYNPLPALASSCPCGTYYVRPSTAVALDASSGSLVATFGLN